MAPGRRSMQVAEERPRRGPLRLLTASMTSAATRIKANARGKANKPITEPWQADAWDVFDLVPEVGQATTFMANVVGGVRLFIAQRPEEADEEPVPAPEGMLGVAEARMTIERLATGSSHGGIGGLLTTSVVNLKIPGDCFLLGEPPVPPNPAASSYEEQTGRSERWDVKSIDEVEIKDKGVALIRDYPGQPENKARKVYFGSDADPDSTDTVFLLRVWDRHPRYAALARSSLRAALQECDELLLLSRAIRATARQRISTAGILALTDDIDMPVDPAADGDEVSDPQTSPFMERLTAAMLEPINDTGSVNSVVPIVVQGDKESIAAIKKIDLGTPFDPEQREIRKELLERLGASLDLPIEQLTGIAKVNHWGAWQVDAATWARYGQPTTRLIVESWTEGLLWPMLEEAGIDPAAARQLMIWFDPADAIMDPDESKTADELFDRGGISWEAYRQRKGAGEDEAPDDAELDRRAELGLFKSGSHGGSPVPNGGELPNATATSNGNGHRHRGVVATARVRRPTSRALTAASRRESLGRRLMEIDRTTRLRLEEGAEHALRRALELAGSRVRSAAQKDPNMHAALKMVPAHEVCSRLNRGLVAQLGLQEDELLAEGVTRFAPRFDQRIRTAQRQTRDALAGDFDIDEDELNGIERRQDRDRHDAWHWLSASLLLLARDRLYDPSPALPAQGEASVSSLVPPGILRQAMSIAGGGDLGVGMPQGGVATGRLVLDVWAAHGQVVDGWEWVHGGADRPFEAHADLDGVQFATWEDDVLTVRDEDGWLDVAFYQPGDHAGCVVAGTMVEAPGLSAASLRWYEGELVEFVTAAGEQLAITPNHPVLTEHGWIAAGILVEGDYLVRCFDAHGAALLIPDDDHAPARIEDLVAARWITEGVRAGGVPVASEDFDGDGAGSKICVVLADSDLRSNGHASLSKPEGELFLSGVTEVAKRLARAGSPFEGLPAIRFASLGFEGKGRQPTALIRSAVGGDDELRVPLATWRDADSAESLGDRVAIHAESLGKSLDGLAGFVEFDKVVHINRSSGFSGHVFNLHTDSNWYLASNLIVHNCQCDFVPLSVGERDSDETDMAEATSE